MRSQKLRQALSIQLELLNPCGGSPLRQPEFMPGEVASLKMLRVNVEDKTFFSTSTIHLPR